MLNKINYQTDNPTKPDSPTKPETTPTETPSPARFDPVEAPDEGEEVETCPGICPTRTLPDEENDPSGRSRLEINLHSTN
jgi:hypothetical protein